MMSMLSWRAVGHIQRCLAKDGQPVKATGAELRNAVGYQNQPGEFQQVGRTEEQLQTEIVTPKQTAGKAQGKPPQGGKRPRGPKPQKTLRKDPR